MERGKIKTKREYRRNDNKHNITNLDKENMRNKIIHVNRKVNR